MLDYALAATFISTQTQTVSSVSRRRNRAILPHAIVAPNPLPMIKATDADGDVMLLDLDAMEEGRLYSFSIDGVSYAVRRLGTGIEIIDLDSAG
ncbi:MAG: hypothetical protein F4023_03565 [Acidobacteria bacterium]|nr:hypothetical protein [Acidobacteriota bacterium]MYH23215.1 hypothetical protein [Acidobacteriota bacterium]MYK78718.1 hypothetical protein [Acidobacteriota bacterium]